MPYYVGLDASKRITQICVVNAAGAIVKEASVETDPKAIISVLRGEGRRYRRVGMEAWGLSPWLFTGLARAGLPVVCIEVRHASEILKAIKRNKTDRNDARGIAEMMRVGLYKAVDVKTPDARRLQTLLLGRRVLKRKAQDLENVIADILLCDGLKSATGRRSTFERRTRALVGGDDQLLKVINPLLNCRRALLEEFERFDHLLEQTALNDTICQRLMTVPDVGPLTALLFRVAIDVPERFAHSRDVGPQLGLVPVVWQSGPYEFEIGISRAGNHEARSLLVLAAHRHLMAKAKDSWLKAWGKQVEARRGRGIAAVAVARRLAILLHRMWITETDFRPALAEDSAANLASSP